ncbi:branched-chain amino acid ABC transporter permease [Haladaptatus halobius]|uniref:branched-chain amino acid ABC transporter permease n=1 Tax=Haladaptatus halobius TaxID=2884875 RepID=UPI001D0AD9E8|nr:branched-chain amino acid ABC transporter permease [Haladaptatus halobius]
MASVDEVRDRLSFGGTTDLLKFVAVVIGFALLPVVFGTSTANTVVVLAVFAMGYNLLLGYGGELSFGHAAFFGLGAYGTILAAELIVLNLYISMVIAIAFTTLVSFVFGYVSLRRRGIYFAMITLALAQMVYYVVFQWNSLTGGQNGKSLPMYSAPIAGLDPLSAGLNFYVFALVLLALTWLGVRRVIQSPFGKALMAVRESEDRARHLGYNVNGLLLLAFTLSGALAGLAGTLHAVLFAFVGPEMLFWTISGEVVLIAILGGIGTLNGPIVGAVIFGVLSHNLTKVTQNWPLIFGTIFVLVVMFAPEGVYGLYQNYFDDQSGFDAQSVIDQLRRGGE